MRKLHLIIIGICLVAIIIALAITTIIINNKSKEVNSKISQDLENLFTNEEIVNENLEGDCIDINELVENTVAEEPSNNSQNVTSNTNNKVTGGTPYYIKVNYGAQVVTIYKKDSGGNYTVPVKAMVCSTGTYTPKSGVYSIPARWEWLRLQGYVWGHYSTQIKGNILFHSVPYLEKGNLASLEYWEYDKLGTAASAGCVRLTVRDAKWIYDNCKNGTKVEFYSDSHPGPLGKPSAKKISNAGEILRNWDPTDSNDNNPWKNNKEENNEANTNVQTNTPIITNTQTNEAQVNESVNTNTNINAQVNETTNTQANEQINTNSTVNTNTQDNEDKVKINAVE